MRGALALGLTAAFEKRSLVLKRLDPLGGEEIHRYSHQGVWPAFSEEM